MAFNIGFMCPECGPIQTAKKRSISKVQYDTCPTCSNIVTRWERPLNKRSGRCNNCANASFTSAIVKSRLLRCCKKCSEVVDIDSDCKVIRKGDQNEKFTGVI
jgi:hypothetical protein